MILANQRGLPNLKKAFTVHDKPVLATSVYESIKTRIMEHSVPPGARLNIDALAQELKVSPTPVREALARLAAEKVITFEPFRGYAVNPPLTPYELSDLMHVRTLLECEAARIAASRIAPPDLLALQQTIHDLAKFHATPGFEGYMHFNEVDRNFHEIIFGATGNRFLLESYRSLNVHVQLARFYDHYTQPVLEETVLEHRKIYDALEAHDAEAAVRAIQEHLNIAAMRAYGTFTAPSKTAVNRKRRSTK